MDYSDSPTNNEWPYIARGGFYTVLAILPCLVYGYGAHPMPAIVVPLTGLFCGMAVNENSRRLIARLKRRLEALERRPTGSG
jgi:hypothetical protein